MHLDWHVSHYVKLLMDEIFGQDNFRNEIIWAYPAASVQTKKYYMRSFDAILFYSKSDNYLFNDDQNIYMEYSDRVKNSLKKDELGVYYHRGGSHDGIKLSQKVYIDKPGVFPRDVWNDIPYIRANTKEYQGFSTQKPERLLKRIILASSNEDDIIADFFCGTGTSLLAAEKLNRRWIGCDITSHAIHICRKRLLEIQKSNDLLNWKRKYGKKSKDFEIWHEIDAKEGTGILKDFLLASNKDVDINLLKENCDFEIKVNTDKNVIGIELRDYTPSYLDIIETALKKKISSFSDWIDYWAIDFNKNDTFFNTNWASYRTQKRRQLALESNSYKYNSAGMYTIQVKVIDIFGITKVKEYPIEIN